MCTVVFQVHGKDRVRHEHSENVLVFTVSLHQALQSAGAKASSGCKPKFLVMLEPTEAGAEERSQSFCIKGKTSVARTSDDSEGLEASLSCLVNASIKEAKGPMDAGSILPRWTHRAGEDVIENGAGWQLSVLMPLEALCERCDAYLLSINRSPPFTTGKPLSAPALLHARSAPPRCGASEVLKSKTVGAPDVKVGTVKPLHKVHPGKEHVRQ
mmetsp:Transcript_11214/g.26373  ORF Transcript_11214/g.26373 Transcript_11214/m.26373 type:complete len:213 (+) Transcript_11214:689-1327(+)